MCEGLWLQKLLEELHITIEFSIKLYCDNKAAISISHNPIQHDKTKHIEVDRHFIKEKIEKGIICMTYIPIREQLADIFTKGLQKSSFQDFICKLDMINIYDPTWEGVWKSGIIWMVICRDIEGKIEAPIVGNLCDFNSFSIFVFFQFLCSLCIC